jgi:tripartite-type tricarboxylate transporter receptor subunit TctC
MFELNADARRGFRALLACVAACACAAAVAQGYPERPVQLVVPFPPGGVADLVARPIAAKLGEALKQPVLVEDRGGGSGTLGAGYVAKAAPDGYTLLLGTTNEIAMSPPLYKALPYNPTQAFVPLAGLVQFPNVLVVAPTAKAKSLAELLDYIRAHPGKVTFASSGVGSTNHLSAELMAGIEKLQILNVPYRGGGPALTDVMAGNVDAMFATLPSAMAYIRSGKLRALAVTGTRRSPVLPDVPTAVEAGVPGLVVTTWNGVLAPAGTPVAITQRLSQELLAAAADPQLQARYAALGAEPIGWNPQRFAQEIQQDYAKWTRVIHDAGIKAE